MDYFEVHTIVVKHCVTATGGIASNTPCDE